jgi:hypothetical protein
VRAAANAGGLPDAPSHPQRGPSKTLEKALPRFNETGMHRVNRDTCSSLASCRFRLGERRGVLTSWLPGMSPSLSNLARLLQAQGELAAHDKMLGIDHPWTRDSARVNADALSGLGRADEAATLRARYCLDQPAAPGAQNPSPESVP